MKSKGLFRSQTLPWFCTYYMYSNSRYLYRWPLRSGEGRASAVESPGRAIKGPSRETPSSEGEAVRSVNSKNASWNAALTRKHTLMYNATAELLPRATLQWYDRGGYMYDGVGTGIYISQYANNLPS